MISQSYLPTDYHFTWTSDWYTWDAKAARTQALKERAAEAKRLKAEGYAVKLSAGSGSLMSKGGIGSGHPHIELWTTAFYLHASKP